jgi:hypothetical protein
MKKIIRTLLFLGVIMIAANCKKDESFSNDEGVINPPLPASPITATVQGVVFDENNQPVLGAAINAGNKTATTDAKGFFRITNAALDKNASVVIVDKNGYFKAYRTFQATSGANLVVIKLIKIELIGTISNSGGNVTLANGSSIALPANAVVKKAGGAYSGSVNVYASYIDPTKNDIAQTIPGSYMADDKNGRRVTLKSYGMLAVELETTSGEKLQIAEGKTAQLTAPIPASLSSTAPATIALWYVDEQTGIWKEQGTATKTGNNYVGNVSHFTFWNYDASFPAINLSFTLKSPSGDPLAFTDVWITRLAGGGGAHGYTDSLGRVSGLVPSNENLLMEVYSWGNCGGVIYTQNIGPFSQNTSLGDITVTASNNIVTITGKLLNCSGQPVTNGTAILNYEYYPRYLSTNNTGDFSTSFIKCSNNSSSFTLLGIDNTTQQQGATATYTITGSTVNVGNILACGNSAAQFITYTLDGTPYSMTSSDPNNLFSASLQNYNGTNYNWLNGNNNSNYNRVYLNFNSNAMTAGTYPLLYLNIQTHYAGTFTAPSSVTVTNFPQVINEFYEGNFSATFRDSSTNVIHNSNGVFRLRRNN